MQRLFCWLLRFYPYEFREEFGSEMARVFGEGCVAAARSGRTRGFLVREYVGLIAGALRERLGSNRYLERRLAMRSPNNRFRFPLTGIGFMIISLAVVLYVIREARAAAQALEGKTYVFEGHTYPFYGTGHISFLQTFGFAFGVSAALALIVVGALYAMRRAGVHRLAQAQTWPVER
jgi:hypothetical protein